MTPTYGKADELSDDRFRAVAEHLSEGMLVIQDEVIVFANARASQIVGMSIEEMRRVGFLYRVHPDDRELVLSRQRARLAGEQVPDHYELRLLLGDGSVRWIGVGAAVVPWGGAPAALVFFTDTTDSKETLLALRRSEERYRVVVDNAGEGIVVMVEDRIVFANARACEIVRLPLDQILGTGFLHRLHPQDRELMMERRRLRLAGGDPPSSYEVRFIDSDGSVRWMELGVVLVPWEGALGTMTFFTDVTARKQFEAERRQAEEDAREALRAQRELNELRARFVAMTSHEFRTPLATILSSAELLRHYAQRMNAQERDETLTSIEQSVQRMRTMLDRVLLISRADAHVLECHPRDLDLHALCRRLVEEVRALHPEAPAVVQTRLHEATRKGRFDENLLRHILTNLLSNALKYSPAGGTVTLTVEPDTAGAQQGPGAAAPRTCFIVQDEGIGIPPGELDHLFASFHRASNVGDIPGTGLGLVIVQRSVEAHGGQIELSSVPGQGTRFVVRI